MTLKKDGRFTRWAPIWKVPDATAKELSEHGWQLLEGNAFFFATVVFMVGVAVMLWMRRRAPFADSAGPETGVADTQPPVQVAEG